MQTQTHPTTNDLGHLLLEIATAKAMTRTPNRDPLQGRYVDTGLTPAELCDMCLMRIVQGAADDLAAEAWTPMVVQALDYALHEGRFRFHLSVQEALGSVRVLDDESGEAHVFVTAEGAAMPAETAA